MKIRNTIIALLLCMAAHAQDFAVIGMDSIEYELAGHGEPWIVLVSGVEDDLDVFQGIKDFLARKTTVLCYSRSGLGKSTYKAATKSFDSTIEELKDLLDTLDAPDNIILGAHSYGGLIVRAFTTKYPDGIRGIVSVDPTFEDYFKVLTKIEPKAEEYEAELYVTEGYKGKDDDVKSLYEVWQNPEKWEGWFNVPSYIPHFVLTSTKIYSNSKLRASKELMKARYEAQRRTIINSNVHLQMAVPDAGHYIQSEKTGITFDTFMMMLNICR